MLVPTAHACCKQQAQEFVSCVFKVDVLSSDVKVSGIKSWIYEGFYVGKYMVDPQLNVTIVWNGLVN